MRLFIHDNIFRDTNISLSLSYYVDGNIMHNTFQDGFLFTIDPDDFDDIKIALNQLTLTEQLTKKFHLSNNYSVERDNEEPSIRKSSLHPEIY